MLKIKLKNKQNLWFCSDPHFGHSNLCKGTTRWRDSKGNIPPNVRDFSTLDKMNDTIVNNINEVVQEDDILICLGDWSFGGFDNIRLFRNRIICKNIYLVTGNHDDHIVKNKDNIRSIFTNVIEYYTQLDIRFESNNEKLKMILCHFPIASWENMSKGVIQLFGHVHLPPVHRIMAGKAMDVGMDGNNMYPISLNEVIKLMEKQPKKPLCLPHDHHEEQYTEIKK